MGFPVHAILLNRLPKAERCFIAVKAHEGCKHRRRPASMCNCSISHLAHLRALDARPGAVSSSLLHGKEQEKQSTCRCEMLRKFTGECMMRGSCKLCLTRLSTELQRGEFRLHCNGLVSNSGRAHITWATWLASKQPVAHLVAPAP